MNHTQQFLQNLYNQRLLPASHTNYLARLSAEGTTPSVVYDVGACVLHWYREAVNIWPNAQYFEFDVHQDAKFLYERHQLPNHIGVLSSADDLEVDFYLNSLYPGGCSYYKENGAINSPANRIYTDQCRQRLKTLTLDTVVTQRNFPLPNLIKMDVQGAELDIVKGSPICVQHATDIILELQTVDFNQGAPKRDEVIDYMDSIGFDCLGEFSKNKFDADYHFRKKHED